MSPDAYEFKFHYENGLFTGEADREDVSLTTDLPRSIGTADGVVGTRPIAASWEIASNYNVDRQPLHASGLIGAVRVELNGEIVFTQPEVPVFRSGRVAGTFGDSEMNLAVAPCDEGARSVAITGSLGSASVGLTARVASDLTSATVIGEVNGAHVAMKAKKIGWGEPTMLNGSWAGPYDGCVLAALCLTYFM